MSFGVGMLVLVVMIAVLVVIDHVDGARVDGGVSFWVAAVPIALVVVVFTCTIAFYFWGRPPRNRLAPADNRDGCQPGDAEACSACGALGSASRGRDEGVALSVAGTWRGPHDYSRGWPQCGPSISFSRS